MDTRDFLHPTALTLTRQRSLVGLDGRDLRRGREKGEHVRLLRGVYVPTDRWKAADDDQYLMRIQAAVLMRRSQPVLSHLSAARVWDLPILGRWPAEVHFLLPAGSKRTSRAGVVWHYDNFRDDDVVEVGGYLVTSRLRTMVDLARTTPFASAVASLNAGLRAPFLLADGERSETPAKEELQEAVARLGSARGCCAARVSADFADGQSESTGESVSRANIHLSGMPAPLLQVAYPRLGGGGDRVDFRWEARHHIRRLPLLGEFDGKANYTRDQYLAGRTIEEVVWIEKVREDRLRAPNRGMVRWLWAVATSPTWLRTLLIAAGLRPER